MADGVLGEVQRVPTGVWIVLTFAIGAYAVSPYWVALSADTAPMEATVGYLVWLVTHPVRALGILPLAYLVLIHQRGPY